MVNWKPKSYLAPTGKTLEWITKIHRGLYRATGGIIGLHLPQWTEDGGLWPFRAMRILLLTTIGRKTGLARTAVLPYFEYDGRIIVVGSFAGQDVNPAWYYNVKEKPEVDVQIGRKVQPSRAVVLEGADRAGIWSQLTAEWGRYAVYQTKTSREIPLVELVPTA